MIELYLPPKPAIIRTAAPWERRVDADLQKLRLPWHVRHAIVAELRRIEGGRRSLVRATLSDLDRYGKLAPFALGGMLLNPYAFGNPSSVAYLGVAAGDGTGSTSESVTIDFGTGVAGSKIVVVLCQANWSGSNNAPSTCTIDGQSASSAGTGGASSSERVHIYYFDDASGVVSGSSTVAFTWSDAESIEIVAAYRLAGVVTGAATNSAAHNGTTATTTLSLNCNANAILVAGSIQRYTGDQGASWTGVTEDNEGTGATGDYQTSTGSGKCVSTESPRTVTCVWDGSPSPARNIGMAAVWDQAA